MENRFFFPLLIVVDTVVVVVVVVGFQVFVLWHLFKGPASPIFSNTFKS